MAEYSTVSPKMEAIESDSDNEPLIKYVEKEKMDVDEDSDKDPDYVYKSDDSDEEPLIKLIQKKKARKKTSITKGKENKKMKTNTGLELAVIQSKVEAQSKNLHQEIHLRRVNELPKANGLKMNAIPENGDCLIQATLDMVFKANPLLTTNNLRSAICSHILEFRDEYKGYVTNQSNFQILIEHLAKPGSWDTEIGNIVPYAIANLFQCKVMIYTSRPDMQIVTIQPSLEDKTHPQFGVHTCLCYAYVAVPNFEHYNSCMSAHPMIETVPVLNWDIAKINSVCISSEEVLYTVSSGKGSDLSTNPKDPDTVIHCEDRKQPEETEPDETDQIRNQPKDEQNCKESGDRVSVEQYSRTTEGDQELEDIESEEQDTSIPIPRVRRKIASPEDWKANRRIHNRLLGHEYTRKDGSTAPARKMKLTSKMNCKFHCTNNFDEIERGSIFSEYWSIDDRKRKQDFICNLVQVQDPKTCKRDATEKPRRNVVKQYYLRYNDKHHRVCKEHFLATFGVSEKVVDTALQYKTATGIANQARKVTTPWHKIPDEEILRIKKHIEGFPRMQSHYCRKDTKKEYLDCSLNVVKMHTLYTEDCQQEGIIPQKIHTYRGIFTTQYNLGFHHPRKDLCSTCEKYKLGAVSKEDYEIHKIKKDRAREEKGSDKDQAKTNDNVHAVTFDLEQVLAVPKSKISTFYYRRKINFYNLSVYSLGDGNVSCFMWGEPEGKRGACEIGSCLINYISSLPSTVDHVILISDGCGGQNRNKYIYTALLYALEKNSSVKTIEQKFLVSGHTEMEVDSVHSAIERGAHLVDIFNYDDWYKVTRLARKRNPYSVLLMKYKSFLDLKSMAQNSLINPTISLKGERVQWLKICHLVFVAGCETVKFRYSFDEEFQEVLARRPATRTSSSMPLSPIQLYENALPISKEKKADLSYLCKSGCIPSQYHEFYNQLACEEKVKNMLPEAEEMSSQDEES